MIPNILFMDSPDIDPKVFDSDRPVMIQYNVTRKEAETQDFRRTDRFLTSIAKIGFRASASLLFCYNGYDFDPAPLNTFPEVVKHTREVVKRHPYIWYYLIPQLNQHILGCVVNCETTYSPLSKTGQTQVRFDIPSMEKWYEEMVRVVRAHAFTLGDASVGKYVTDSWKEVACL